VRKAVSLSSAAKRAGSPRGVDLVDGEAAVAAFRQVVEPGPAVLE
jgi:hypothetical protein